MDLDGETETEKGLPSVVLLRNDWTLTSETLDEEGWKTFFSTREC